MTSDPIEAILFDVGGTLLRVDPSVGDVYSRVAAEHGFRVAGASIQENFRSAWRRSLQRSQKRGYETSDSIQRMEWLNIVRDAFGDAIPASAMQPLFEDLYQRFISADAWRLAPNVRETLAYLRSLDLRLGVLSNWDSRLERLLHELELSECFDFVVASHAVGVEKPHPKIFQEALRRAGTVPSRTVLVGDSFQADIEPAVRVGMRAIWVAAETDRQQEAYSGLGFELFPSEPGAFWGQLMGGHNSARQTSP